MLNNYKNMEEDKIKAKLEEHDQRFDEVEKTLGEHDVKFEEIKQTLGEHDLKFEEIKQTLGEHDLKFEEIKQTLGEHDLKFEEIKQTLGEHDVKFEEIKQTLGEHKDMLDILIEKSATKDDIKDLKTAIDTLTITTNATLQELRAANSNSKVHTNKNLEQDDRIEKCEENIVNIKSKLQMAV